MTLAQIQALIDAAKSTPSELVTWSELKTILEAHKAELGIRGVVDAANTTVLQSQSGANTSHVLVSNIGLFAYAATGTANGTTIFNASGGGVWNLVLAPGTGGSTAFSDITGNALDNTSLYGQIFDKGLPKYATTGDLATVNVTVSDKVIVPSVGILAWTATGPANGTTIFAGLGGFWQLIMKHDDGTSGGTSGRQTGTLATDDTIALTAGRYYSRILLNPASALTAGKIGTTLAGEEVLPESAIPGSAWYNVAIDMYAASSGNLYLAGITSSTQYILFYE